VPWQIWPRRTGDRTIAKGEAIERGGPGEGRLSAECRIVQAPGVLAAPSDGELLLIREPTSAAYVLRGSGADIWNAARQPVRIADVRDQLMTDYDVDSQTCEVSLLRIVEELLREHLFLRAD
jgi:hypothetical protein